MGSSSERSPFRTDRLVLVLIVGATLGMVVAGFGLLPATSAPSPSSSLTSSLAPTQTPVNVTVGPLSSATPISREFWGVDISAQGTANSTDGARLAATPVKVLRYPGGSLGERLNISSNLI